MKRTRWVMKTLNAAGRVAYWVTVFVYSQEEIRDLVKKLKQNNKAKGYKLRAEGYELREEGYELRAEADKLCAEGYKLREEGYKLWEEVDKLCVVRRAAKNEKGRTRFKNSKILL